MLNEALVALHKEYQPLLAEAESYLRSEVEQIASGFGGEVQLITSRCKSISSLQRKLARPDKTYGALWQITDLIGIRVIAYFERTVDAFGAALENALQVDYQHSINKLNVFDAAQFGYRSLHYVCGLSGHQAELTRLPPEFRFEVQVRTVLQHAWAEIEHDLGYKANDTIPPAIRRRFSRVASLLEVADEEFESIRSALSEYADEVQRRRGVSENGLALDRISLEALVESDQVRRSDNMVSEILQRPRRDELFFPEYLLKMLSLVGIKTVADCQLALRQHTSKIDLFVPRYFQFAQDVWQIDSAQVSQVELGYSLFFVAHIVLLEKAYSEAIVLNGITTIARFYQALDYPDELKTATRVAEVLYRAASGLFVER
jgi:ppGpp synthetase/RelA/SpoT-type nucleotidyltranferase